MRGRVCLVTGASSGIGRTTALALAGTGVTADCVHPGAVETGIWRDSRGILRAIIALLRPEEGDRLD